MTTVGNPGRASARRRPKTPAELARIIDYTLLRADATQQDIDKLCARAISHNFACVTINPVWTAYCARRLSDAPVGVNPVIGFPLGANTAHVKLEEAREALKHGATELDVVMNIGAFKSGFPQYTEQEIAAIVKASEGAPVKVILETSRLSTGEKRQACELCVRAGAAFVKTSTGFAGVGCTAQDVALMRKAVGPKVGVKAAGGIRTLRQALMMIEAGANRIGASKAEVILKEMRLHGRT